jgi:hypothetical protein
MKPVLLGFNSKTSKTFLRGYIEDSKFPKYEYEMP